MREEDKSSRGQIVHSLGCAKYESYGKPMNVDKQESLVLRLLRKIILTEV